MNCGFVINESHVFDTHLNFNRDFTGSLKRISVMSSWGKDSTIISRLESCIEGLDDDDGD